MPTNRLLHNLFILTYILTYLHVSPLCAQGKMRIQGTVVDMATNLAIENVNVVSREGHSIGLTDIDGKFTASVDPNASIYLYHSRYADDSVKINFRQVISVGLAVKVHKIGTIVVRAAKQSKVPISNDGELSLKGNYLHLSSKFFIPTDIFTSRKRLIIQPVLSDNQTKKILRYYRPAVLDGWIHDINVERIHSFEPTNDSLYSYKTTKGFDKQKSVYIYKDSVYIGRKGANKSFKTDCYIAINGTLPMYDDYLDTITIVRGLNNPMQFLEYEINPLNIPYHDSLAPKPEMRLLSDSGTEEIGFVVGRAKIDTSNPNNMIIWESIKDKIRQVLANENALLKAVSIKGYASPEGNLQSNQRLAQMRTNALMMEVVPIIGESLLSAIQLNSSSQVEPWSSVAGMLERDSLPFASLVRDIVTKNEDKFDLCQGHMWRIPEYRPIIVKEYLPRLRRVEYTIEYNEFRQLTDADIMKRFDQRVDDQSRYEFWQLLKITTDSLRLIQIEDAAYKRFPNFSYVSNRIAVRLLERDSMDMSILEPSLVKDPPLHVTYNQALIALNLNDLNIADSLVLGLPHTDQTSYIKAILAALNGRYAEAYPIIATIGGINKALIQLCLKDNEGANNTIMSLLNEPDNQNNARMWYIRAVCANRLDDIIWAMESLRKAIYLDPSLKQTASRDTDVMDILEIISLEL